MDYLADILKEMKNRAFEAESTLAKITEIIISEPVLDEILRRQMDNMEDGQSAGTTLFLIKEEIHKNTTSIDDQIREQANELVEELVERKEAELKERFASQIEDAVSLQQQLQQLDDAYKKNAQLGKMLVDKDDVCEPANLHIVADMIRGWMAQTNPDIKLTINEDDLEEILIKSMHEMKRGGSAYEVAMECKGDILKHSDN